MSNHHWGYGETNGPDTWCKLFPAARGARQSPINIEPVGIEKASVLCPLSCKYDWDRSTVMTLQNTGHAWQVNICTDRQLGGVLVGGPLENVYKLAQFHCHWGERNDAGSEHTVGGKRYAAELHLVHWNSEKYKSFQEAVSAPDGLCVLGVFLEVGKENAELRKIVDDIHQVRYKGQQVALKERLELSELVPQGSGYWTYSGSLTTPPCSECVVWIVYQTPMQVSQQQLEAFRTLKSHEVGVDMVKCNLEGFVKSNIRPTVPIGNRIVKECRP